MMTKEGSTKIVNFMTSRPGVLMLGVGHISHYSEYVLSSTLSIYSTLIAIVLRNYDAAFRYHSWFSFILWWGCWYTNMSPFWQEVSVKSLILRWPLRPVDLLFTQMESQHCRCRAVKNWLIYSMQQVIKHWGFRMLHLLCLWSSARTCDIHTCCLVSKI